MNQHVSTSKLDQLTQATDLVSLSPNDLVNLFLADERLAGKLPSGDVAIDPRNGDRVLFSSARDRRPYDRQERTAPKLEQQSQCPICSGDTTGIVDRAALSQGSTFINKNLYPIMYPFATEPARGLHFLQWTSSYHHRDWHNMPVADAHIVLSRLAALEAKFIDGGEILAPEAQTSPYVSIIKNSGTEVGASLSHGHQQIAVGNIMPRRIKDHLQFFEDRRQPFSQWMLDQLNPELTIMDYGSALLVVPHFMKRPYDMLLLLRDYRKSYLHQLEDHELSAVARGWHQATAALHDIMPRLGKNCAYNLLVHNGPGAGLYFEFKPHTQIRGGYERMGLYICQGNPMEAAADVRAAMRILGQDSAE